MTPTTSELIRNRLADESTPSTRSDDFKLALAVEGGGMRSVLSAGMLLALEQLGMRSTIDFVVGTSAGALASAFFVAGRSTEGSALFYTELNAAPFLDRRRLLRGGAAIDLDYLISDAARRRGLDFDHLNNSELPLYATVSPVDPTNPSRMFRVYGPNKRIASILTATAALPVLAGGNRKIDDEQYVDGGLYEQVPWRTAASLGATHVLVLPSRPVLRTADLSSASFVERIAVSGVVRLRHGEHVADMVSDLPHRATEQMWALRAIADGLACMIDQGEQPWTGHLEVIDISENVHLPGRLESSRPKLVDGLLAGAQAAVSHFKLDAVHVEQRVVLTHPDGDVKRFRTEALREYVADLAQATTPVG